jgi:hypothetical protein
MMAFKITRQAQVQVREHAKSLFVNLICLICWLGSWTMKSQDQSSMSQEAELRSH